MRFNGINAMLLHWYIDKSENAFLDIRFNFDYWSVSPISSDELLKWLCQPNALAPIGISFVSFAIMSCTFENSQSLLTNILCSLQFFFFGFLSFGVCVCFFHNKSVPSSKRCQIVRVIYFWICVHNIPIFMRLHHNQPTHRIIES